MTLDAARAEIRGLVNGASSVVVVRRGGNTGDRLIWMGTHRLLDGLATTWLVWRKDANVRADVILLVGSGGWCKAYHGMPETLAWAKDHAEQVIVLPSSFERDAPGVAMALSESRAIVYAREPESYRQIRDLCDARIAHDCALYFDFEKWRRPGVGVLHAFRTDREKGGEPIPADNEDISVRHGVIGAWLDRIAQHEEIHTDRAHVMIAAALLHKRVRYRASAYHKVPEIARHSLRGYDVEAL